MEGEEGDGEVRSAEEDATLKAAKEMEREELIRLRCEEVRQREEERRQNKLMEKEEKKRSKEEQRWEKRMRQVERKRRKERIKELERELKRLRIRMDNDIQRRRAAARQLVQVGADAPAGMVAVPQLANEFLIDDAHLEETGKALPLPPSYTPSSNSRFSSANNLLSSRTMADVLQVWDVGYTLAGKMGMSEWPSLSLFLKALDAAEACKDRHPTLREERRMRVLSEVAQRLTGVLLPDIVQTLMYSSPTQGGSGAGSGAGIDPDPTLPLNEMTWPELARWAFMAQAYRVMQLPVDLAYALRGRGVDFQMDAWDKKALTMGRLRVLMKHRGTGGGRGGGGGLPVWSRTAFTLCIPTPNPLRCLLSGWQVALESLRCLPGQGTKDEGRWGPWVDEHVGRALSAVERREGEVGVGVVTALQEASKVLAPFREEGENQNKKGWLEAIKQAVEKAMTALDMYQSNLGEGGVWKELETDPIAGSMQRGGEQRPSQAPQQEEEEEEEAEKDLLEHRQSPSSVEGAGGKTRVGGSRSGVGSGAGEGEIKQDGEELQKVSGTPAIPSSLNRVMTSESIASMSAPSVTSTTGHGLPQLASSTVPSFPASPSLGGTEGGGNNGVSLACSTASFETDSLDSESRRSSAEKERGGRRGKKEKRKRRRSSLGLGAEGEECETVEGKEEEDGMGILTKGGEVEEEEDEEDEEEEEEEEDEEDIDAYRDITPEDFEAKAEIVRRCYAILQALMQAKGGSLFKYQPHVEGYGEVVARPLGLMDVTRNLRNGQYDDSVGRFATDVRRVFINCALFNPENDVILHDADRLVARFDRLLLQWVLDVDAPPLEELGLDTTCKVCRDPYPQSVEVTLVGGIKEWRQVSPQQCNRCDASFHPDCVKMPVLHPNRNVSEQGKEKEYWFCEDCIRERMPKDVDPFLRLRVVKHFPGVGAFAGRVASVRYTREKAVYTLLFRNPSPSSSSSTPSFFEHKLDRNALCSLLRAQGLPQQNPELAQLLLQRPAAIDAKCEYEALGHCRWGLGYLLEGESRLPRKLDPELSLVVRRWINGGDVELVELLKGIRALDAGVGGRRRRKGGRKGAREWVACLVALAGQAGGTVRVRDYLEGHEEDLRERLGEVLVEGVQKGPKEEGREEGEEKEGNGKEEEVVVVENAEKDTKKTEEEELVGDEDEEELGVLRGVSPIFLPGAGGTARVVQEEEDFSDDEAYAQRQEELLEGKEREKGEGEETESEGEGEEWEMEEGAEADEEGEVVCRRRGRSRKSVGKEETSVDAGSLTSSPPSVLPTSTVTATPTMEEKEEEKETGPGGAGGQETAAFERKRGEGGCQAAGTRHFDGLAPLYEGGWRSVAGGKRATAGTGIFVF
jgi:hypothetical protein